MNNELRKKYVCIYPFRYTEISDKAQWLCCPSWLPENIHETGDYKKDWHSDKAEKIRESILDGSYKYCSSKGCPYLSQLDAGRPHPSHFIKKENFNKLDVSPAIVNFGFDTSCNLQCPSCRLNYVNLIGEDRARVNRNLDKVQKELGSTIRSMILCGAADPFFSKSFFNFLRTLDKSKYPKLKDIHLLTNGTLWTPKNWELLHKIHPYVKSCEISIDAATKDTYENKVRLRGDWDKLMDNIKFILTIKKITRMRFSFVTQAKNYNEMLDFYNLITDLTKDSGKKVEILYNGIVDWGAYPTKEDFLKEEIHNPQHPEFNDFLVELEKIKNLNVNHNFHHIIERDPVLI